LTTAKRDIARVKTLWREHFLRELADLLAESIAQYRLVQTKAWAEYDRRPSANYLRVIIEAQSKIDDIQGNQAPKEMQIEEIDIETVRKKRWEDVMDMLPALLDSEEENG
jgi:hypothetical protein